MREREAHFVARLAHAGKDHFARITAGRNDALKLATGDDVKARAQLAQQTEDGEVGIRFHRITDQRALIAAAIRVAGIRIGEKIVSQAGA